MRLAAGLVLGAVTMAVAGAAGPTSAIDPNSAEGIGAIHFGKKGESVGFFDFNVIGGAKPGGTFVFGAEDHDHYPNVVLRLEALERVVITGNTVTIKGRGMQQEDPVRFTAAAVDGTDGRPDTFRIDVVPARPGGAGELHAAGEVFSGNIRVGAGET